MVIGRMNCCFSRMLWGILRVKARANTALVPLLAVCCCLPLFLSQAQPAPINQDKLRNAIRTQSTTSVDEPARGHGPTKTIKLGKARFDYYENPEAVAASTTFYVSGSETKSHVYDFVALNVAFYNRGKSLMKPSAVHFSIYTATYRDGCKFRERYANQNRHLLEVNLITNDLLLFQVDLALTPTSVRDTRNGKLCMESYRFTTSFEQFVQLTQGRKAKLNLGTREFTIKANHLDALRAMVNGIGRY